MATGNDSGGLQGLAELMALVADRARLLGATGVETAGAGVEEAINRFVRGRAERAVDRAETWSDQQLVQGFIADEDGVVAKLTRRAGKMGVGKATRRLASARSLAARSPAGLALRYGPEVVSSVLADLRAVDALCRYLAGRSRDAGVAVDVDRLTAVVIQVLVGDTPDPDATIDHNALVKGWLGGLGRRLTPFIGNGPRGGNVDAILLAASTVDPKVLGGPGETRREIIEG